MKEKLLHERALVTCIAMLFICIILKLFGVQWFDLNTDIPMLQEIDKVVMNSVPLSFLYSWLSMFINFYLITILYTKNHTGKLLIISTLLSSVSCIMLKFILIDSNSLILFLIDILCLFANCHINIKTKLTKYYVKEFILIILVNFVYQCISLFVKGLGYQISYYGLVISCIYLLDYYMMLIITYLYLKKGDETLCSIFHQSFSYLNQRLLKKRSENYSNKEGN